MPSFHLEPLGDMVAVGAVDATSAKIWLRSERPGAVVVRWEAAEGAADAERNRGEAEGVVPEEPRRDRTATLRLEGLSPDRSYHFTVLHRASAHPIGEGRLRTAPAGPDSAPDEVVFGMMSCHMPFDEKGRVLPEAEAMLAAGERLLTERGARFFLTIGDQMYTDCPPALSLFDEGHFADVAPPGRARLVDCTKDEMLGLFHDRYRRFWNLPAWKRLHARFPSYPIWDDHEIIDNWGSDPAHDAPPWSTVGAAAREACFHYQMSRVLGRDGAAESEELAHDFDYGFDVGDLAFYVLDLRSSRRTGESGRIFSDSQEERLRAFLTARAGRPLLFLVLSVPLLHLPRWLATLGSRISRAGEDFSDRWASLRHQEDRDVLLDLLHEHGQENPQQRVVLLSGDIHIACAHEVAWRGAGSSLLQIVSSGVTNEEGPLMRWLSEKLIRCNRRVRTSKGDRARVRLLKGRGRRNRNPFRGLNLALVEVGRDGATGRRLRCTLHGYERGALRTVFESEWIPAASPVPKLRERPA